MRGTERRTMENIEGIVRGLRYAEWNKGERHGAFIPKRMAEYAASLLESQPVRIAELEAQLAEKDATIKRQQEAHAFWMKEEMGVQEQLKAQLAASQRETQAALAAGNRMAKAFALLCRMLDDFAGLPPCHIRQIDWPECNGESEQCGDRPIWQCWQKYILEQVDAKPVCRVCGCTEDNACLGGCYWVEPDLCSACAQDGEAEAE